jgi:glycosyltransferase involved in cell wall biosynthesis
MAFPIWFALIRKPSLRKVLLFAHILTRYERERYAGLYGLPPDRFVYVPWPLRFRSDSLPPFESSRPTAVVCSGRAACDWETLFKAAESASWPLTVVCSASDRARVTRLNRSGRVRIRSEVTADEHQAMVSAATVYILCLRETDASAGQVRLMNAIRGGAPVVATRVRGLEDYARNDVTACVVEVEDAHALRACVDQLLSDPASRERLRASAFEQAGTWTFEQYLARLQCEIDRALAGTLPDRVVVMR